ncbi:MULTISPECIES: hypothetical protein [Kitasatospora]|uniref:Uncharacterized protein n=1 Tax=Kitasatospora cystarginea TaxID=58350 RepID=A0ABN3DZL4_9ACTN
MPSNDLTQPADQTDDAENFRKLLSGLVSSLDTDRRELASRGELPRARSAVPPRAPGLAALAG